MLPADASAQRQFRLAGASDSTSNLLGAVTTVGQVRGYQANGNLQVDYGNWLEASLLNVEKSAATRRYLLDWYGIRWVFADPPPDPSPPTRHDLATYEPLQDPQPVLDVRHLRVSTRRRPSSPPAALRLRSSSATTRSFALVLRALAAGDVDSRQLVTVQGPATLDDIALSDIRQFDTVFVYGAKVHSPDAAARMLSAYVRSGGRLVVEDSEPDGIAGQLAATAAQSVADKRDQASARPARLGLDRGRRASAAGHRHRKVRTAVLCGHGRLGGGDRQAGRHRPCPAHVGHAPCRDHKQRRRRQRYLERARAALPRIRCSSRSPKASSWAASCPPTARPLRTAAKATFVNSERRELTAGPEARGVLLKEHLAPDWHATVNGHDVPLWSAGPGMMWVSLPEHHGDVRVVFDYRLGPVEQAGYGITGLALLVTRTGAQRQALAASAGHPDRLVLSFTSTWCEAGDRDRGTERARRPARGARHRPFDGLLSGRLLHQRA